MKISRKLRSRRGLTLTEMLVALAILGLVSGAIATGISSSLPVYQQSVALSESEVLTSTLAQALSDELRYARDIRTETGSADLKNYTSTLYGAGAAIAVSDGKLTVGGNPLIGSGAYTSQKADVAITYVEPMFTITLTISQDTRTVRTSEFSIRALNA